MPGQHISTRPLSPWEFATPTTQIPEEEYADLEVIDLSAFRALDVDKSVTLSDNEKSAQDQLIARTLSAFRTAGFVALTGHGLSTEDIHHHFDLGKMFADDVSEEEKHELHANIQEANWAGYKPQGYYRRPDGAADVQEHYDFYPFTAVESRLPRVAKPYLTDFREFIEHNHYVVVRKVLGILSLGLGLPMDTLWNLHHRNGTANDGALRGEPDKPIIWKHSKDHLRYCVYNPPATEEERLKKKNLWLPGHTDLGSITLLYSQPVAGLQVLSPDGRWRYVRHYPDHIIVDLGDSMEFITGGVLKASPHRVVEPPLDQRHLRRLGIFYFVPFLGETPLVPLDYPSLHALGAKDIFKEYLELGGKPLTSQDWLTIRSKLVGTKQVRRDKKEPLSVLEAIHFRYNPSPYGFG